MDLQTFSVFAFAALMLNITPGNDMVFVATHATNHGIRAGVMASLGIAVGCLVHILAATVGVSAIIAQSAFLFDTIKYIGAAYLIYIGLKSLLSKTQAFDIQRNENIKTEWSIFKQGVITNVLNPKVALFFLAFLPQFVPPQYENTGLLIALLGLWFNFSGTVVNTLIAIAFGKAGNFLNRHPTFVKWQEKFTGLILILLGLKVAFLKKN
ncbi:MAG: LysE family translocator [Saprospiraceae bacterium]|nr:LysE family translocator [Saprospiraceae bacterium]